MRALSLRGPRQFEFIELPEPSPPGPNEALVSVRAIGLCGTDLSGYLGKMPFIQYPRILGHELGVEVLAVGGNVTHLEVGDHCSVEPYLNCGTCHSCSLGKTNCCEVLQVLGVHRDGGMTHQLIVPAHKLHSSKSLTFSQLAIVETLAIGCHAVDRASVSAASSVLIIGAGPIGLSVLEFARLKTNKVAVVERDQKRREFIQRHYSEVTVFDVTASLPTFEVVFDATGNANSMAESINHAQFGGRIVYVGITPEAIPLNDALFHRRELSLLASRNACSSDFPKIIGLIESGRIDTTPWITCTCNFEGAPALFADLVDGRIKVVKAIIETPF
jgi:alcohol dehydrogenase